MELVKGKFGLLFLLLLLLRLVHCLQTIDSTSCTVRPGRLRTNSLANPLGIPDGLPRLSWLIESVLDPPARNQTQSAYRIQCSSRPGGIADLWDSGLIYSSDTLQVPYNGKTLLSSQRVFWRVSIFDGAGNACETSEEAWFETALLQERDWRGAVWLSRFAAGNITSCELFQRGSERNRAPFFRRNFRSARTTKDLVSARAYISGLGYYQLYINGQRVGTSYLDPGWTTTQKRVLYAVYDVTEHILGKDQMRNDSLHAVGVELGNGWWNPLPLRFWGHVNVREAVGIQGNETSEPMFRLLIIGIAADGSTTTLVTSDAATSDKDGWRAFGSPTLFNNIYLGEAYDARLERGITGWALPDFDDSAWATAVLAGARASREKLGVLEAQSTPPIRRQGVLPVKLLSMQENTTSSSRTVVFDVGRNIAGACRYRISGNVGDVIKMRYGELLNEDKSVNVMTSVAGQIKGPNQALPCQPTIAFQGDELTLSGKPGGDDWMPSWSWHGFRFIEVTTPMRLKLAAENIECYPMRTDVDLVANFSSSDPFLAELRTLVRNTFDSNLMSVQSDCPHRERFGYGGDPLGCGEAGLSIYDWATFYRKRVRDFNDAQQTSGAFTETSPYVGIGDGGVLPGGGPVGWEAFQPEALLWLYKYYGDKQTLAESFNATYAFVQVLDTNPPGIEHGLGDWMPAESTDVSYTGKGFQLMSYLAFANITDILGMHDMARSYRQKASSIVDAINARFLNISTGAYVVNNGSVFQKATQCGQGMALFLDIVPKSLREEALKVMEGSANAASFLPHACQGDSFPSTCPSAKGGPGPHMTAGLFGIKWFLMSLADGGMNDLAYEVLTTPSYPSFAWMMNNPFANATTIWESWFFSDNVFSHNHPMFASSEVWLLQSVAGIQPHPAAKGMDHVLIKPSPPSQIQFASASYETPRGRISTSWKRIHRNGKATFVLDVVIPPNVAATVHIPTALDANVREGGRLLEDGQLSVSPSGRGASLVVRRGSGAYSFECISAGAESVTVV